MDDLGRRLNRLMQHPCGHLICNGFQVDRSFGLEVRLVVNNHSPNLLKKNGGRAPTGSFTKRTYLWRSDRLERILWAMRSKRLALLIGAVGIFLLLGFRQSVPGSEKPEYTTSSQLRFPEHYREWVFLSAGFDMSYSQTRRMNQHMFDNVFASPDAYQSFLKTGTWPDKTMLVLESRRADSKGSINKVGNYQGSEVMGLSVHVKDESRFPGKWAFFTFDAAKNSKLQPPAADCYSCHGASGAVDTTFVQFYPTLLTIAEKKGTLTPAYQKENTP